MRGVAAPVQAAFAHLEAINDRTLDWQCAVTRIAAPTGGEAARAAWMMDQFVSIGWTDVCRDGAGNVLARRRSHGAVDPAGAVWSCAHLDTVFALTEPVVHRTGPRLSGPGIGDNGRGLAALLAIADAIHVTGLTVPADLVFACTVAEEGLGDLHGMRVLMRDAQPTPRAVIAIDGPGDECVVNAALGGTRWRLEFHGAGGHSWADVGIANPLHVATQVATTLHALRFTRAPRVALTVTRIGGGESINSIPRQAWLELDVRGNSYAMLSEVERSIRATVAKAVLRENRRRLPESAPVWAEIRQIGNRPCGAVAADAPLVRLALDATRHVGRTPALAIGSTDASVPIALGIPAIAIGAGGRGGGIHTPDEWYDDTDGVRGLQRALLILVGAAGLPSSHGAGTT